MKRHTQIALAFRRGYAHRERLIEGITAYAHANNLQWSFMCMPDHLDCSISLLKDWNGGGAITILDTKEEIDAAQAVGFPVVNVSSAIIQDRVPTVTVHNEAIGRLASEHLLEQGFRRFAFYGTEGTAYSALRLKGFRQRLEQEDFSCQAFRHAAPLVQEPHPWLQWQEQLAEWIETLKTPVGIFAANDHLAWMLLTACHAAGLTVPQSVGILGCDNDETICEHAITPLSSVARNIYLVGSRSAELLHAMIKGDTSDAKTILIRPERVVQRASTDTHAVDEPRLAIAIRILHTKFNTIEGIEAIQDELPVSRRWLENAFNKEFNISPYRYLLKLRLKKACEALLMTPSLTVKDVAARCGFSCAKQLGAVMHREFGCSPTEYRRKNMQKQPSI